MGQPIQIRVIGKELTERLLRIDDVLSAVDETFQALGRGQIFHPVKEPIWLGEGGANMLLAMPAHLKEKHIVGVKWVNMYPIQQPGLPASYGNLLILSHEENGQPYALLEATAITATAAAKRPTDRSPSRVSLDRVSSRVPNSSSRLMVCRAVSPSSSRFSVQGVKAMR